MATFRGMDGSVTFAAAVVGEIKSWSINASAEMLEDTAMGDKWKTFVGGIAEWSGQATANLDYGDTNGQKAMVDKIAVATPASTGAALEFLVNTGKKYTGTALVSGFQITQQIGEIVQVQFDFQGSGALAVTWA